MGIVDISSDSQGRALVKRENARAFYISPPPTISTQQASSGVRSSLHIQRKTNQQIPTESYNMSVSFKVALSKGEEQETRRFQVDKEVASSLVYLKQKIAAIFPELRRSEPVLSWVDEDGDEVVVTSDEELQVALTALTGPVYKLKVKLGDKAKDGGNSGMARSAQVHWGVVCDGCDGAVVGPRHKCLVCPDYDLCATCEARGLHVHHKMIRLPAPCKRGQPYSGQSKHPGACQVLWWQALGKRMPRDET